MDPRVSETYAGIGCSQHHLTTGVDVVRSLERHVGDRSPHPTIPLFEQRDAVDGLARRFGEGAEDLALAVGQKAENLADLFAQ